METITIIVVGMLIIGYSLLKSGINSLIQENDRIENTINEQ